MYRRYIVGAALRGRPSSRPIDRPGRPRRAALTRLALLVTVLVSLGTVTAQEEETYEGFAHGIRANAVKGEAVYERNEGKFPLEPGLKLEAGDTIKTAPGAYAEILLQPGNYLRTAGDTELQIINDEQDRMRFKLIRGTLILEILSRENMSRYYDDFEARYLIRILTPSSEAFFVDAGIFRLDATAADRTDLIVRNGVAVIRGQQVKAKHRATASRDSVTLTEIDSKSEDEFDAWARERADTQVRANKALKKTSPWTDKHKERHEAAVDLPEDEPKGGSPLIVSAKPGAVNFVEAGVEFSRKSDDWEALGANDHLETGDRLHTAANTFAELTLFPDMYFRVAGASEVLFEQLSNDGISIKILKGSAILEVARFERKEVPQITLAGPATAVAITNTGNYRVDANANSDTITIRDGKVTFKEHSVGSCRVIAGGVVSECEKKRTDNFDYWSRYQGEGGFYGGLSMAAYLAKSRRLRFRNTGFWFQSPGQTSYTFVPFRSIYFRSPYGGSYTTVLSPRRRFNHPGKHDDP